MRSSIPFSYEPFNHPRLKELRFRYKLDEVVKGATTELELIERLAVWSAGCWERGHLKEGYPPWDALEILKLQADGTNPGGQDHPDGAARSEGDVDGHAHRR